MGLLATLLLAASVASPAAGPTPPPVPPPARAAAALPWPAGPADLPTTDGAIYFGNLDARIEALAGAQTPAMRVALAGARYHRFRITGALADAEAAEALLDGVLAAEPARRDALLLRATVRAGFHRFEAAREDLAAARAAGAPVAALEETQRELALATGQYDALADLLSASRREDGGFYESAFRGNLRLQQGDLAGASRQFQRAQGLYSDSSPMPLAWLHLQQGIALLRSGRVAEANAFFRAAHVRLPGFTLATEHLAETEAALGRHDAARALYAQAIAATGSPEFMHALAGVERAAGDAARAAELEAEAAAGWRAWTTRYPAAFAQHAIPYYVEVGDAARALELARVNIGIRQDVGSWILLAQAAHANGDARVACDAVMRARGSGMRPPEMAELEAIKCAGDLALH